MWILLALLAACAFAGMFVFFRFASLGGASPALSMLYLSIVLTLSSAAHVAATSGTWSSDAKVTLFLVAAGVLSYLGNVRQLEAISRVVNPGYATAVCNASALLLALVSVPLFGAELTMTKLLGPLLVVAGVVVLGL